MDIIKVLGDPRWWSSLLGNDFNRGFIAALVLILALIIFLMLFRGILFLIFRARRCSHIIVQRADGNTVVGRDVIAALIERELAAYPAVSSEKIVLTRQGRKYQLTVYCRYLLSDQSGLPAFCDEFKPRLIAALEKGFGVTALDKIRFWVSTADDAGIPSCDQESCSANDKEPYIGL